MHQRVRLALCAPALVYVGVASAQAPVPPSGGSPLAGTYLLSVCKGSPCEPGDSANTLTSGYLVLLDTALSPPSSNEASSSLGDSFVRGTVNACYSLRVPMLHSRTYAGLRGTASTHWEPDETQVGGVRLTLYNSPDASYDVRMAAVVDRLEGRGVSRGGGNARLRWPSDTVVARRLGPADTARCSGRMLPSSTPGG